MDNLYEYPILMYAAIELINEQRENERKEYVKQEGHNIIDKMRRHG